MRVNYAALRNPSSSRSGAPSSMTEIDDQEPEKIFYLKLIRRNLNDFVIMEPVALYSKIMELMVEVTEDNGSRSGLNAFENLRSKSNLGPGSLAFFNAPLHDGSVIRFEVIEEYNPEVARVVASATTYTVRYACPLLTDDDGMLEGTDGRAKVKDIKVFKTFTARDAAQPSNSH